MENIMETRLGWKLEAVGDRADAFDDLERPGVAWAQLALRRGGKGMGGAM